MCKGNKNYIGKSNARQNKVLGSRLFSNFAGVTKSPQRYSRWQAILILYVIKMKQRSSKHSFALIPTIVVAALVAVWLLFFSSFISKGEHSYIYIDNDDTADSVAVKLSKGGARQMVGYRLMATVVGYGGKVKPGRYEIGNGISTFSLVRNLRNGRQAPVELTIASIRTVEDLAGKLSKQLEADSLAFLNVLRDESECRSFGLNTQTISSIFLPNTYEIYWNTTPEQLLKRMKKESDAFWTDGRKAKAKAAGLTPVEVITLASIVDQETANNAEKPDIAGMYLNRLHIGMKLQADPTVKFALKDFSIRRIMHEHLTAASPYNTYRNKGLPPGPICIPSLSSIEAVLNYRHHNYIYMCAKEDFSGTHNFAETYDEHLQNAKRYADALNKRGIK